MSRFFATASDSESESSSSENEIPQLPKPTFASAFGGMSDDEDEQKRIVRTAKEKRFEELNNIIRQMRNYKKIRDMSKLLTSFEDLTRAYQKALPVILKEEEGIIPRFYVRCLVEMEDFVNDVWEDRDGRKNMSKNNSKALGALRQKLRKYTRDFEDDVIKFRVNPDVRDEDDDEDNAEILSDEDVDSFKKASLGGKEISGLAELDKGVADGETDDSTDWGSDSESSSETEGEAPGEGYTISYFLKKTTDKDDEEKKKKKEKKKEERIVKKKKTEEGEEEGEWTTVKGGTLSIEKPKMFAKDAEINHNVVLKKLQEILAARGKKGTDRKEQIDLLNELKHIADAHELGAAISVKICFAIISSLFDYNPAVANPMRAEYWEKLLHKVNELLDILIEQKELILRENISEENEVVDKPPYKVCGCMLTVIERMDEEFIKMLKECDAHSTEYVERLKDEKIVCELICKLQNYLEQSNSSSSELCRIYLRRIEHIYYKFDSRVFEQKQGKIDKNEKTSLQIMDILCKYIYAKDNTDRLRTRAILCHIYHFALHDSWYQARDLIHMSHLQDTIHHSDPPTQILYNRTMVQLGLCAFRHGNIMDAHNALLDIQSGGRAKELLAQGLILQRQQERTSEQEKIEKQRQMPFHMHINLELLECVYLVSAMLIEIPYMAAHEFDARRRMISKSFHHQLKVSERQALVGPPESMREHVVAASKAMRNGNWKLCHNYIINEKMNSKVWDLFYQADKVRDMLTHKIQIESLRTYLFTHSSVYDSISLPVLAEMFNLDLTNVHSIVSKMIINEELMASLDEPTKTIVMHRTEPSRLQSVCQQLADKISSLVEWNERILEMKQGSGYYQRLGQQQGYRDRDRQMYGNRQNVLQWGDRNRSRQQERVY